MGGGEGVCDVWCVRCDGMDTSHFCLWLHFSRSGIMTRDWLLCGASLSIAHRSLPSALATLAPQRNYLSVNQAQ